MLVIGWRKPGPRPDVGQSQMERPYEHGRDNRLGVSLPGSVSQEVMDRDEGENEPEKDENPVAPETPYSSSAALSRPMHCAPIRREKDWPMPTLTGNSTRVERMAHPWPTRWPNRSRSIRGVYPARLAAADRHRHRGHRGDQRAVKVHLWPLSARPVPSASGPQYEEGQHLGKNPPPLPKSCPRSIGTGSNTGP